MKYQDQVEFIGVAWTGSEDSYQGFIDKHGLTFPQINDSPGDVFDRFDVAFQPVLVIVKTDGSMERVAGAVEESLLEQIISESI